jgi:sugar lactone lactonase YvrE
MSDMTERPMRTESLVLAAFTLALAACGSPEAETTESPGEAPAAAPAELPARIVAERGGFIPEGVEYDAERGRLLTGSLSEGDIFQIDGDGRVTAVITDPELLSSVGIEVDAPRDRLLVANSDRAVFEGAAPGQARLGVYDLNTGTRLAMVDLAATIPNAPANAAYFANDAVSAPDGTIYVTDTMQNVIYRVTSDYQASVWHRFPPSDGLGLNGIVHHPSGYLLVAGGSVLYKVPVSDPAATTPVTLPEAVEGQDGMVWTSDGRLAIVSNSESRVVALSSNDDWATAQLAGVAPFTGQGTTGAVVGDDIYVVQPHFADAEPPVVERVTFR